MYRIMFVCLAVFFALMCGYAFAKGRFFGKNFWFIFMLAVMMIIFELRVLDVLTSMRAADALLKTGKPFEINTGAVSRGYRTSPYPDREICRYILDHGGKLIFSSDSHAKETIGYGFEALAKEWPDPGKSPF